MAILLEPAEANLDKFSVASASAMMFGKLNLAHFEHPNLVTELDGFLQVFISFVVSQIAKDAFLVHPHATSATNGEAIRSNVIGF